MKSELLETVFQQRWFNSERNSRAVIHIPSVIHPTCFKIFLQH